MPDAQQRKSPQPPVGQSSWKRHWVLALILLLAAGLRLYGLGAAPPGLCYDEAANAVNAMEVVETGRWQVFYPENNGREGLFINLQGMFVMMLQAFDGHSGVQPWMFRAPSAVFGILTVLGLYLLTCSLSGSQATAAATALMLATSFWHVNFSRIGFRAISAPFWLVWSLFLLLEGLRTLRAGRRHVGLLLLAAGGICHGLGFHSYIAYRIMPLLPAVVLAWWSIDFRRGSRLRDLWVGAAVFFSTALLAVVPLALYFFSHPGSWSGHTSHLSVFHVAAPWSMLADNVWKTFLMFNFKGDSLWRHNISGSPQLFLPVGILFLAGIVITVRRRSFMPGWIALLWLVLGVVPAAFSNEGVPHAVRTLLAVPAACLLAGFAADGAWSWLLRTASTASAGAAAIAFALLLTGHCWTAYFGTFARAPQLREMFDTRFVELGNEIYSLPLAPPKYIIVHGADLDAHGVPTGLYSVAIVAGAYSEKARRERNIQFVVSAPEAERVAREPYAYVIDD